MGGEAGSMSVVAVRNGIIAADSLGLWGRVEHRCQKLYRHGDVVIGAAGNSADEATFRDWYFAGADRSALPTFVNREGRNPPVDFTAIVAEPGKFTMWDEWFVPEPMSEDNDFWAIGGGAIAAMAAMYMGATAIEAVEAACSFVNGCGLPVEHEVIG